MITRIENFRTKRYNKAQDNYVRARKLPWTSMSFSHDKNRFILSTFLLRIKEVLFCYRQLLRDRQLSHPAHEISLSSRYSVSIKTIGSVVYKQDPVSLPAEATTYLLVFNLFISITDGQFDQLCKTDKPLLPNQALQCQPYQQTLSPFPPTLPTLTCL